MTTLLYIASVLFATALMAFLGTRKTTRVAVEIEPRSARQHSIPRRWSNLLIVLTVVYCFLLLAGLSYAGWFHVS